MFGTRRLAKRSIIGSRVCAPWTDGRFYPGVIQSTQTWPNGEEVYSVLFDDSHTKTFMDKEIIGPGFQTITTTTLRPRQKVFITFNGREVAGVVARHIVNTDEVLIIVENGLEEEIQVTRKLEEVRLLMSRKSARLLDQDTDYSRLADFHPEPAKKRAVSHVIDVPTPAAKQSRRRKGSPSPEPEDDDSKWKGEDIMDEQTAAMVLTSLSCSPVSPPAFPHMATEKGGCSPGAASSSIGSSGVWGMKSEASTPSPPQTIPQNILSQSAPSATIFGSPANFDEGIELDDTGAYFSEESGGKRQKVSTRTVYKCTWPGCGKLYNTCQGIEKHVRIDHLGPKEEDDDSDNSDHEEEFYYTEIEVTVDTMTQTFADMYTSSPPEEQYMDTLPLALPDHDYQKKEPRSVPVSIPHSTSDMESVRGSSFPLTMPINIPQLSRSLSWTNNPQGQQHMKLSKSSDRNGSGHLSSKSHLSSSPKSSPMHKKSRSEIKKCRKVYGMENREMWCTQCKWKKACSRFFD